MDISRKCARFVFAFFALLVAGQSLAEIYKCQQPDGVVVFSDEICDDGKAETISLLENSPLDSTAERENIARYNRQELRAQRKSASQVPQVLLIGDSYTAERNARISPKAKPKKKKKKKSKAKKRRQQSAAVKDTVVEITH